MRLWTIPGFWLDPSVAPLFVGSSILQTGAGMWGVFSFRTDARALVGCGEIFFVGKCPSFSSFFFFFFFFLTLGTLFCIYVLWRRGTRGSHVFGSDWAGGLVSGGNFSVSRIFQGKREVPLTSHFCSLFFFSCYSVTFLLRVVLPITCVAYLALCLLSFPLILRYVPYLNFISFPTFCLFEFLSSFFSAFLLGE